MVSFCSSFGLRKNECRLGKKTQERQLLVDWQIDKSKKLILLPGRLTPWKGQEMFIQALSLVNKKLGYESFYAVILGNDQGRNVYTKKLKRLET